MKKLIFSLLFLHLSFNLSYASDSINVYYLKGPFDNLYRIEEIDNLKISTSYFGISVGQKPYLEPPFPKELKGFDVIIFGSVRADSLGVKGRLLLRKFVKEGGGILFLGGYWSYLKERVEGTFLEDILPVRIPSNFNLIPLSQTEIKPTLSPILKNIYWNEKPICLWAHNLLPKEGTEVILKAGDIPLLILGSYGKGKVAAFTGTTFGIIPEGSTSFWESKEWPKLLRQVIFFLSQKLNDGNKEERNNGIS